MTLAFRDAALTIVLALAPAAAGCGSGGESAAGTCTALDQRLRECARELPRASLTAAWTYCKVALAEVPESGGTPSVADLTRAALVECAAARDCASFDACFDRTGCRFFLSDPSDTTPELSCMPAGSPAGSVPH